MEPYFSTKPPGGSAGLGLPFVYRLITRSRGRVEIDSIVGEGTTVTLKLEAAESPAGGIDRAPMLLRTWLRWIRHDAAQG